MTQSTHKLQWFRKDAGSSDLQETNFVGSLEQALAEMDELSSRPEFLLGMVLQADGLVLATVAANGAKHVNNVAQANA